MKKVKINLKIVALFTVAMLFSLIPELSPTFFGDELCNGNITKEFCSSGWSKLQNAHTPEMHWGYRHWLFFAMGLSLFVLQAVDIINEITD